MTNEKPQAQPKSHPMDIRAWPVKRLAQGIGVSVKDGWNFGIGFGLAMAIAVPLILLILSCFIGIVLTAMGASLGGLL